jgi:flagella basal body P-ring formation protein FlgA
MTTRSSSSCLFLILTGTLVFLPRLAATTTAGAVSETPVPFAQKDFVAALAHELAEHFNLEGDLQLETLRTWNTPTSVAKEWQVEVTEFPSLAASSMLVRCRVLGDGVALGDSTLVLRAMHLRDAWVARQPLSNGSTFDPSLLETRRVDLFRDRDALPAVVGDRSFYMTRSVQPGRFLTWRDVARRPLVRKGDLVEVSASEGTLSITLKGLAMQNGAQGEAVTIRNLESRKDFTAFVVDENRVQVRF